jgi:hypothetical protein
MSWKALTRRAKFAVGAGAMVVVIVGLAVAVEQFSRKRGGDGNTTHSVARASSEDASSSQGLDVLPFPGTPDASPGTDVDFPAVSQGQLGAVRVVGSRSGRHRGRLSAQPDGRGTAFSPDRQFAEGERVSVTACLRSAAAAAAAGAPGKRRVEFSFSVARPVNVTGSTRSSAAAGGRSPSAADRSAANSSKTHSFVTHPDYHVPWITTSGNDTDTTSGHIFLNAQNTGQNALYFLNGKGEIQWYHPAPRQGHGPLAFNARVQNYRGRPVITYWQGKFSSPPGAGRGEDLILNSSYKTIHKVRPGNGYQTQGFDLHDFTLTPSGTALAAVWTTPVHANLTSVGGPANGTVYDWIIQEVDAATNKVVWEWHALGHVPISASYRKYVPGQPYDYFHLNSIQQLPDGRILISARHTWAVYSIDKKTGKIAWELGGKHSSFKMGPGTRFFWQHHATLYSGGRLTVFDDGAFPQMEGHSRALLIHISTSTHQATLIHAYTHTPPVLTGAEGSAALLGNHNMFVGWGSSPYVSEYTPSGMQIFSDGFRGNVRSYRAYRLPWTGHPPWPPSIAVRRTSTQNHDNVYVSWNGATQVVQWRVLVGPSSTGPFKPLKTVAWASFETRIPVSTHDAYFKVQGLGRNEKLLTHGTSPAIKAGP